MNPRQKALFDSALASVHAAVDRLREDGWEPGVIVHEAESAAKWDAGLVIEVTIPILPRAALTGPGEPERHTYPPTPSPGAPGWDTVPPAPSEPTPSPERPVRESEVKFGCAAPTPSEGSPTDGR